MNQIQPLSLPDVAAMMPEFAEWWETFATLSPELAARAKGVAVYLAPPDVPLPGNGTGELVLFSEDSSSVILGRDALCFDIILGIVVATLFELVTQPDGALRIVGTVLNEAVHGRSQSRLQFAVRIAAILRKEGLGGLARHGIHISPASAVA